MIRKEKSLFHKMHKIFIGKQRIISLPYKILVVCLLITGIALNALNTKSVISLLSYYTLQSNIICLIAFICFVCLEVRKKPYKTDIYYVIKGAIIIAILVTAVAYRVALAPNQFTMDSLQKSISNKVIANLMVHTISPMLVIADYFLFDEKGKFKAIYPIFWLFFPLNYVVYVYLYSYKGGKFYSIGGSRNFAYFFLDYEVIGYMGVAKWLLLILVSIVVMSYVFCFLDYQLSRRKKKGL